MPHAPPNQLTCGRWIACGEWIPGVAGIAAAHWAVRLHGAGGMHAAHPRTGVAALVPRACKLGWTFRVGGTLGPTLHIGVALQAGQAGAGGRAAAVRTLSVYAARRRSARVANFRSRCCCYAKTEHRIRVLFKTFRQTRDRDRQIRNDIRKAFFIVKVP